MFQHSFFGGFARQRSELLEAKEFAPLRFFPAVEEQISGLAVTLPPQTFLTRGDLFRGCLYAIRSLVFRSLLRGLLIALIALASVWASRQIVNQDSSFAAAAMFAGIFFCARIAQASLQFFNTLLNAQVARGIQGYLMRVVNQKIQRLDRTALPPQLSSGQLKTLVSSDVESVEDFLSAAIGQWGAALMMVLLLGPALVMLAGWIGFIALILGILFVPMAYGGAQIMGRFQGLSQAQADTLTTMVGEWVRNIRLVRYLGWQRALDRDMRRVMKRITVLFGIRHSIACVVWGISFGWWMVPVLGSVLLSQYLGTPLTLPTFFALVWLLENLDNTLRHLPHSLTEYGTARAGADRILEVLKAPELSRGFKASSKKERAVESGATPVAIHLRDVTVAYGDVVVLGPITASLPLAAHTAIVGEVASGKSTLLEVLIGERIPTTGEVLIQFSNGDVLPLWIKSTYELFRQYIAYAPQRPFLSNNTLRLNIDLGGNAQEQDILAAVEDAQLTPDMALFPRGLHEEVGETGINLSGGQKQRVSFARAFLSKRDFYFLDDPLSAVDTETESRLMHALIQRSRGMVIVSHRLGELDACERVLVLQRGKIVEDGKPSLLRQDQSTHFSHFVRALMEGEQHGN